MGSIELTKINKENAVNQFLSKRELILDCFELTNNDLDKLNEILKEILVKIGKEKIFDYLSYCYKELLLNAQKANTKRLYFESHYLNINNPEDYKKGMKEFKSAAMSKLEEYMKLFRERGYYIRTHFKIDENDFYLYVKNNVVILEKELEIIKERKKITKEFKSIDEALSIILNNEEGAGLGIIISILMLKKLGLTLDAFNITKSEYETISSIKIPLSLITEEQNQIINNLIVKEVNDIPQFPDNIIQLQTKLSDPDVDIKEISLIITKDASLTAEILKFTNSAFFMVGKKISSISEAIKLIGLKGLRNIIYSYGTQKTLSTRYNMNKMSNILNHSYKVSFFAYHLIKMLNNKDDLEDSFVCGILHDIGKIVLLALNPALINKINSICHEKEIPIRIIEDLTSGYNHSTIGGMLAKKWNFPEKITETIEYHHNPYYGKKEYRNFIFTIQFADLLAHDDFSIDFIYKQLDEIIISIFNLKSKNDVEKIYNRLNTEYKIKIERNK